MLRTALKSLVHFLRAERDQRYPIPGVDHKYSRDCPNCGHNSHVTKGGVHGIQVCYGCGRESAPVNLVGEPEKAKACVRDSYYHWQRWPILPYDFHTLSEDRQWELLAGKP